MKKISMEFIFMLARVALNLSGKPIPFKIQRSRQIQTEMGAHLLTFPTPNPTLAAIDTATDELETAYQDGLDGAHSKKVIQRQKDTTFMGRMNALASYVDNVTAGDELKILQSGMDVRRPAVPIGELQPPANLRALTGTLNGDVDLDWDPRYGAKSYQVEYTEGQPDTGTWINAGVCTASKKTVSSLTSGSLYWFRVSAIGAAGKSNPSDAAEARAK